MVTTSNCGLVPGRLPPTEGAAKFHSLRVHLQIVVWKTMNTSTLRPEDWGWKKEGETFLPIPTDQPIASDHLLKFIRCKCKKDAKNPCGTNRCTCKKFGLSCVAACGDCRGEYCNNASKKLEETDDS